MRKVGRTLLIELPYRLLCLILWFIFFVWLFGFFFFSQGFFSFLNVILLKDAEEETDETDCLVEALAHPHIVILQNFEIPVVINTFITFAQLC